MTTTKPSTDKEASTTSAVTDPDMPDVSDDDGDWSEIETFDWGSNKGKQPLTGQALLQSGLVGIWRDRTDIGDTLEYARELRRRASTRHRD